MSVSDTSPRAGPYTGDSSNKTFAFSFKVVASTDVVPYLIDEGGEPAEIESNFSVSMNSDQDASPGGEVTYPVSGDAITSSEKVVLLRRTPLSQGVNLKNQAAYDAEVHEDALDKLTLQVQQLEEKLNRCIQFRPQETPTEAELWDASDSVAADAAAAAASLAGVQALLQTGTFATLDASASSTMFLAKITDLQQFGVYLGDRTQGENGWLFLGGYVT